MVNKEALTEILTNRDFLEALKMIQDEYKTEMFVAEIDSQQERMAKLNARAIDALIGKLCSIAEIKRGDFE